MKDIHGRPRSDRALGDHAEVNFGGEIEAEDTRHTPTSAVERVVQAEAVSHPADLQPEIRHLPHGLHGEVRHLWCHSRTDGDL